MRNEKKEGGGNNELKQTNKENVKVKKKTKTIQNKCRKTKRTKCFHPNYLRLKNESDTASTKST